MQNDSIDKRSRKVCYVAHCLLNQNAVYVGSHSLEKHPAIVTPLIDLLKNNSIGIEQMPCPEQNFFGFVRDGSCKQKMDTQEFREHSRRLAQAVAGQISKYQRAGIKVMGIIGRRGSPACGVDTVKLTEKEEVAGKGIFIEELQKLVKGVPFVEFDYKREEESLANILKLLA